MLAETLGGSGGRGAVWTGGRGRLDHRVHWATGHTPGAGTGPGVWHERLAAWRRRRGPVRLHGARNVVRGGTRTRRHARRGILKEN